MSKPMPEQEARLRNLIEWLRNRDWAPAGADVCADDIEALLEAARTPGPDVTRLLAAAKDVVDGWRGNPRSERPDDINDLATAIAEHEAAAKGGGG